MQVGAAGAGNFGAYTQDTVAGWGATVVWIAAAGDVVDVTVTNNDGASARNFAIGAAALVKL